MTKMRNFNENEKNIYNNVESGNPKIGQILLKIDDGYTIGNVVQDGDHVQIDYMDVTEMYHLQKYLFVRKFENEEEARIFCEQLPEPMRSTTIETLITGCKFTAL